MKLLNSLKHLNNKFYNTQFKKNIVRSTFVYGLNSVFIFISYPIYLKFLGTELFAIWSLLSIIVSFAELGNFGIGNAIVTFVAKEKAKNSLGEIRGYFRHALYIILVPFLIIVPSLIIFAPELCNFVGVPNEYFTEALPIVPYLSMVVFLLLFNDNLKAVLTGVGRLDLSNILFVICNILKVLVALCFFFAGFTLTAMLLSVIISNIVLSLLYIVVIQRQGNYLSFWGKIEPNKLKDLVLFGTKMMGIHILNMLMMPVCKVILAGVNLNAVAYFEIGSKVVYTIFGIIKKGLYALLPRFSEIKTLSKGSDLSETLRLCKIFSKKITLIGFVVSLFLAVTAIYWMPLWLGDKYNIEIVYCFNIIQFGMLSALFALPYYYAHLGSGHESYCLHETVIRVLLNLLLLFVLIRLFDLNSTLLIYISFASSTIVSNIYLVIKRKYMINK